MNLIISKYKVKQEMFDMSARWRHHWTFTATVSKPTSATSSPASAPAICMHCRYTNDHSISGCLATAATKTTIDRSRLVYRSTTSGCVELCVKLITWYTVLWPWHLAISLLNLHCRSRVVYWAGNAPAAAAAVGHKRGANLFLYVNSSKINAFHYRFRNEWHT